MLSVAAPNFLEKEESAVIGMRSTGILKHSKINRSCEGGSLNWIRGGRIRKKFPQLVTGEVIPQIKKRSLERLDVHLQKSGCPKAH